MRILPVGKRDAAGIPAAVTQNPSLCHVAHASVARRGVSIAYIGGVCGSVAGLPAPLLQVVCRRSWRYNAVCTSRAGTDDVLCPRMATRARRHTYALRRE